VAALVTALVADWATPLVPPELAERVRDGAARQILTIVASSMLVVATFSLGIMVQAFAAAAQLATPRATAVLIDDPVSQNVLSTFLGAFVFGMVALFAHSVSYYDKGGEAVLLVASAALVAVVTATFFGWLDHLANLVRLGETIAKVERRGAEALTARAAAPHLGGVAPSDPAPEWLVLPEETGYVRHVDVPRLQKIAEAAGGRVRVVRTPGRLADPTAPLARLDWGADPETEAAVRAAFTLGPERSFDQDPRFCLAVLTEIASRALSPGVNDPGTAIGVLAAAAGGLVDRLPRGGADTRGRVGRGAGAGGGGAVRGRLRAAASGRGADPRGGAAAAEDARGAGGARSAALRGGCGGFLGAGAAARRAGAAARRRAGPDPRRRSGGPAARRRGVSRARRIRRARRRYR
jgi:hypothetical protein